MFLLLTPIVDLFYSCCNCPDTTKYKYSHKALFLKNLDNSSKQAVETEALQLNKNAYGIRLHLTREKWILARASKLIAFLFNRLLHTTVLVVIPNAS